VTWPRLTYITGKLPQTRDVASYVWDLQWLAHQVIHLGNPWFTTKMAAPAGIQLGFDTTMPLAGLIMTPVTLAFGPSLSFTLLTLAAPGLACYLMFRAARLWLAVPGAIAAGALFGLSSMLTWQDWFHLNIALGSLFLPMTLEAAVRLRRSPSRRRGVILGLVLGASVLVNQESAVMAAILATVIIAAWLVHPGGRVLLTREQAGPGGEQPARPGQPAGTVQLAGTGQPASAGQPPAWARIGIVCRAVLAALVIASPQLIAMAQQDIAGGAAAPPALLAHTGKAYGVGLPGLFAPTTRLTTFGLHGLATASSATHGRTGEGMPMFGLLLTVLALAGLAACWRRRPAWLLTLLWLGAAVLTLGPSLYIGKQQYVPLLERFHRAPISALMPYSWLMHTPVLSALREADRFALLGLVGAVILAGAAVDWLGRHARPAIVLVAALAVFETGWQPGAAFPLMPTALPRVDGPIAADHGDSIVVDVPYGLRGGIPQYGPPFSPKALLIATADDHPRAVSYTSWVPRRTIRIISGHPFFAQLNRAEHGIPLAPLISDTGEQVSAAELSAARRDARGLNIGWVLVWGGNTHPDAIRYLTATGFRFDFRADDVWVYRLPGS
jgi:hypothetical protein